MRLIDVDEHFRINKTFYDADIEMPLHRIKVVLENTPTVEAIPIEWIIEWLEKNNTHYCAVDLMLEDWEEENEDTCMQLRQR